MTRTISILVSAAALAAAWPANSNAALFFLVDRTAVVPNDRVAVRTGWTPADFSLAQRTKPFGEPIRLYLVPNELAPVVHSRFDRRLEFIGSFVPDRRGRGILTFSVPPLDPGSYTLAYWCPACASYSRGRTFSVQRLDQFVERYRSQALVRISATQACPVTLPNGSKPPGQPRRIAWHGNGLLWGMLAADGVYAVPARDVATDGSIGNKLMWATSPADRAPAVSGERLDAAAAPLRVLTVRQGKFSTASMPSWATAVVFPIAGCWRITARVADVRLTYVVLVTAT